MANPTKADFRRALKGRQPLVSVAGSEMMVTTTQAEALRLWDGCDGDIWWMLDDGFVHIAANADANFGRRGDADA